MRYAVLHIQKFSAGALRGIQSHIEREKESKSNPDIDHDKTTLNYDFVSGTQLNAKVNRCIKALDLKKKIRKDAICCVGIVISGSHNHMTNMSDEQQRAYFLQAKNWLENRYGSTNLVYAVVHNDEKTPHMHVGIVPVKDGRLSAKALFTRTELRSLQTDFAAEVGARFGLQRGQEGSDKAYLAMSRYKVETALTTAQKIKSQADRLDTEVKKRANELLNAKNIELEITNIKQTARLKKSLFAGTPHIEMPVESFNRLLELAKTSANAIVAIDPIKASMRQSAMLNRQYKQELDLSQQKLLKSQQRYRELEQTTEDYTGMPPWLKTIHDKYLLKVKAEYIQAIDCINRACANGWHNSGQNMTGAKTIDALVGKLLHKYCGLDEPKRRLAYIKQCGEMMARQHRNNQRPIPDMGDSNWSHRSPAQTDYKSNIPVPVLVAQLGDASEFKKLQDALLSDIDREALNAKISLRDI